MVSNEPMFLSARSTFIPALLCSVIWITTTWASGPQPASPNALKSPFFSDFSGNLAKELKQAALENKQILLYFGAKDCPYCEQMRQVVLEAPDVLAFYGQHYRAFAIDVDDTQSMTDENGNPSSIQQFARKQRIRVTPTLIYFDRAGESLYRQTGYIIRKQRFIELGQSLLQTPTAP
jgi:thioredoxin-related protein